MKLLTPAQVLAAVLSGFGVLLFAAWMIILWMGTNVVFDPHDQVQSVEFRYHDRTEVLTRLPWGTWIGRADYDGGMYVVCRDETVAAGGYVTRNFGFYVTVEENCELTVEL